MLQGLEPYYASGNTNKTELEIFGDYTVQVVIPNHQQYNDTSRYKLKVLGEIIFIQ